ncbi:Uncharacterised protein [Pseudomonas aeruginosa]|nr:Uncharacterised protein [Pseudomonas aeruginosa]CAC9189234.1 Uncharacterised protein [Pseudomonas aeruginosa]
MLLGFLIKSVKAAFHVLFTLIIQRIYMEGR